MNFFRAVRSERIVTPHGIRDGAILIVDGIIREVVSSNQISAEYAVDDVADLIVMPGLVDTHVHINEPGRTEWEGFETATRAAAAGGVTTLVDMPLNSSPVATTPEAMHAKLSAAEGKLWVDCGFYGGVIPGNAHHLQSLADGGVLGFKAFLIHSGIDEFPNVSETDLRSAMPVIAETGLPLLVHCELHSPSGPPTPQPSNPGLYLDFCSSRPPHGEVDAVALMIRLCREYGCRTHIVHLSAAEAIPLIREAREEGLPLTVETCPHYLYFVAEEIPDSDTRFKCAPPIRKRENRERLWEGLRSGVIDFIVSDHSPCPPEMKQLKSGDFMKAWGGISSLQLGLSIVWTQARARGFTVSDIARWMCLKPAEFAGLDRKGRIEPGCDADLVVWDPEASFNVDPSHIYHRHKVTPYEGQTLRGKVQQTYVRGQKVFAEGKFSRRPPGTIILKEAHR